MYNTRTKLSLTSAIANLNYIDDSCVRMLGYECTMVFGGYVPKDFHTLYPIQKTYFPDEPKRRLCNRSDVLQLKNAFPMSGCQPAPSSGNRLG